MTLFDHALLLHREDPDSPLPRDGEPFPDDGQHRGQPRPGAPKDRRAEGAEAAAVLDSHFARPSAVPAELARAFHDVYVPVQPNDHIAAAACRVDARRVQETGRWLIRHATDRCAVTVGLALLTSVWDEDDIPVIQTIGLLSDRFGPLAARALERRRGGEEALLWLADRVAGWGRVYVVESLCRVGGRKARPWLLRRACDGDYLNGYFTGKVATAAHLHEAVTTADPDDELVDHTGRLLAVMANCGGMGMTLGHYPPAGVVLEAHAGYAHRLEPTLQRYFTVAQLADYLHQAGAEELALPAAQRERILRSYLSMLATEDWSEVARTGLAVGDHRMTWLAGAVAPRLGLTGLSHPDSGG
jgi:hypothetical protein